MKRLLLLLALVGVFSISCSDKEETTPNKHQTPTERPEDNTGPENDDDYVSNIPNNEIWYTTSDNTKYNLLQLTHQLYGFLPKQLTLL